MNTNYKRKKRTSIKKVRSFGKSNNILDNKNDIIINTLRPFLNSTQILKLFIYINNFSTNMLHRLIDNKHKLTFVQKILAFVLKFYIRRIHKLIDDLSYIQIYLILENLYDVELRNIILWRIKPKEININDPRFGVYDKVKINILGSFIGQKLIKNIKTFMKTLTPSQLILIAYKDINVYEILLDALKDTKLVSDNDLKHEYKKLQDT